MVSQKGDCKSIYDKKVSPGHGNGHPGYPRKWKGRG